MKKNKRNAGITAFAAAGWILLRGASCLSLEVPELKKIEITSETRPWREPETTPAPRGFEPKNLDGLLEELLAYNPELKGVVEKILALENQIDPAGSLEDPRLSLEGSNIPISPPALNRTAMTGLQLYYRQKVPWPGKLGLKKKIARTQAEQEKQEYYETLNQLVAKFKKTFFDYRRATESLSILKNTAARLTGLEEILEARYSARKTPQQDILKDKVEISNIQETLIELQQKQKILLARMNTLLNRPPDTPLQIKEERIPLTPLHADLKDLEELAQQNRPWLKKSALKVQEAEFQHQLSKKDLLPDFDFGAGWRFRESSPGDPVDGEDFFSAGISINLPVYAGKKQNKEIQASIHQKRMQEFLKTATAQEIRFEVENLFQQLIQSRSQLELLNSRALPQAQAAVESSRINYEAEQVDFLNVLTNEIALLDQRLKKVDYRYQYEKGIADLEMATGLPIQILNKLSQGKGNADENP